MLPLLSFAYYGDYDNSSKPTGWTMFFLLVMLGACILQIILFFKIWGMTNEISEMNDKSVSQYKTSKDIASAYYARMELFGKDSADDYLKQQICDKFERLGRGLTPEDFDRLLGRINVELFDPLHDAGVGKLSLPKLKSWLENNKTVYK